MVPSNPRVLMVGFSERNKYFGNFFHATLHKLRNGFIRAGSHVVWFSDRDIADYSAPFRYRPLGQWVANAKLVKLVETIEPDVICLMHADLIADATLEKIRKSRPATKIVSVYLDPLSEGRFADRFRRAASTSDIAFATTAGTALAVFADAGNVGFLPNPIDRSVERACAYEGADHDYDFFFAGKPKGRERLLHNLQQRLPQRRFGLFLQAGKTMALGGAAYTRTLGRSRIAIAAGFGTDWKWYASDRIAQYLGAGCLVAQPALGDFAHLYGEGSLLLYEDADDLAVQAENLLAGDRWREMAKAGQSAALAVSDTRIVARYVLDRAFGEQSFDWPAWTSEFYSKLGD
ncbi:MAG: glycosyltransferase [Hyphomicrobiaceae bacterium]